MIQLQPFTSMFAAIVLLSAVSHADAQKSDSKIKADVMASKVDADGKQTATITLDIEKDWYIYANPTGSEDYENNRTRVSFKAKAKIAAEVKYPVGKAKSEVIGKEAVKYNIYQGRVMIVAQLRRTPGDTGPIQIKIDVNSCKIGPKGNTVLCLQPGVVLLQVP